MTAPEFEAAVVALLELAGYDDVVASGGFKGKGVDLMAGADGERTAVQATRSAHPVGVAAVRALIDGRKRLGCERGLAVTNNFFWPEAEQCAAEWEVELWDRWKLLSSWTARSLRSTTRSAPSAASPSRSASPRSA